MRRRVRTGVGRSATGVLLVGAVAPGEEPPDPDGVEGKDQDVGDVGQLARGDRPTEAGEPVGGQHLAMVSRVSGKVDTGAQSPPRSPG